MIKLVAPLAIGFLAAMTALIAGIMTDARIETAAYRAVKCFLLSGIPLLAGVFLFDKLKIMALFKKENDEEADGEELAEEPETAASDKNPKKTKKPGRVTESSDDAPEGFVPLGVDNLRRVSTQ